MPTTACGPEYKGNKSKERTISSFDSKKVFTIVPRINT